MPLVCLKYQAVILYALTLCASPALSDEITIKETDCQAVAEMVRASTDTIITFQAILNTIAQNANSISVDQQDKLANEIYLAAQSVDNLVKKIEMTRSFSLACGLSN